MVNIRHTGRWHTSDLVRAREFYTGLFGWKLQDVPMPGNGGPYTMIDVGGGTGGGMMPSPAPGEPSHWRPTSESTTSTRRRRRPGSLERR